MKTIDFLGSFITNCKLFEILVKFCKNRLNHIEFCEGCSVDQGIAQDKEMNIHTFLFTVHLLLLYLFTKNTDYRNGTSYVKCTTNNVNNRKIRLFE